MKKTLKSLSDFIEKRYRLLLLVPAFFAVLVFGKIIYDDYFQTPNLDANKCPVDSGFYVQNIRIPDDLNFCGEKIPTADSIVRENLKIELLQRTFNQSKDLLLNKKANRWFKTIEPILKKNGVPDDFKYVALVESGFMNSPDFPNSGGFWGLMVPVAQTYNLEITDEVDERFNIQKSTMAACKIFKDLYKKYNSWILAAAAYDMGSGALDIQIEKQKTTDYFNLDLNDETATYIYRVIAFKEIISRPELYGYKLKSKDLFYPIPTNTVKVDSSITDLSIFALNHNSNLEVLKILNPWLLKSSLTNPDHKQYEILFPKNGVKLFGFEKSKANIDTLEIILPTGSDSIKKLNLDSVHG